MATPRLTPDQIAQVSGLVFQYITAQRQKYGSRAIPLSAQQKAAMAGFFSPQLLDGVRLLVLQRERVGNPEVLPHAENLGVQESTRSVWNGSDNVLRCCGLARAVPKRVAVPRIRPRGAVSATRHYA